MAQSTLDLGSLDLTSTTCGLEMRLSSQAVLASSKKDAEALEKLTRQFLSLSVADRPYVFRGNSFRMILCVKFEHGLLWEDAVAQVETFSDQLKGAEVSNVAPRTLSQIELTFFPVVEATKSVSDSCRDFDIWQHRPPHHRQTGPV